MEFNQPSREIIQIGAVCMDTAAGKFIDEFMEYVNPNEPLSDYIVNLTGIHPSDTESADQLFVVLGNFWKWTEKMGCKNLCSWGTDHDCLVAQTKLFEDVHYPNKLHFLNLKEMGSLLRSCYPQSKQKGGLLSTMELFGLPFVGRQHDALVDAQNTARLLFYIKDSFRKQVEITGIMNEKRT